jgi:hypothetical protein
MYQSIHPLLVSVAHLPDEPSCSPPMMLVQTAGYNKYKVQKYQHYKSIISIKPIFWHNHSRDLKEPLSQHLQMAAIRDSTHIYESRYITVSLSQAP